MPKVEEIMDDKVDTIVSSTPIIKVAQQMLESGRDVVPVCDDDKFRGIIAERDIVAAISRNPATEPASSLINGHFPVISPDDDIVDAATIMVNKGVHVLPVVKNGRLLGLFTLENLAHRSQALAALVFSKTIKFTKLGSGQHTGKDPEKSDSRSN